MPIHCPFALCSLRECRNPESPVGSGPSLPETCRIPSIFLPDARPHFFRESYPLVDVTLTINKPLLMGLDRPSQTYCGCINHRGYEQVDVIVKLFQQSLFQYLCLGDFLDMLSQNDWISATDLAQREAWAYNQMTVLQGMMIPHSYGFYMVMLL